MFRGRFPGHPFSIASSGALRLPIVQRHILVSAFFRTFAVSLQQQGGHTISGKIMAMEEKKRLYPIIFEAETERHAWGTETFLVADLGIVDSVVKDGWLAGNTFSDIMETYIERISGEDVYNFYGRQFPVAVSLICIDGRMPVQCHPDDEAAGQRYDALGKRTMWYILEASEDAKVCLGFNREMSASELYGRCLDGTVGDTLASFTPHAGDCMEIRPGTVYSASGKLRIISVSESSAITFTLYDPDGKPEDSHIEDAIDLIDYHASDIIGHTEPGQASGKDCAGSEPAGDTPGDTLLSSQEFSVRKMKVAGPMKVTSGHSFTIYICISGSFSIQASVKDSSGTHTASWPAQCGETVLVPADMDEFFLVPSDRDTEVLEVFIEKREVIDDYINPDTEPFLEGEDYEGAEDEDDAADARDDDNARNGEDSDTVSNIRRFFN